MSPISKIAAAVALAFGATAAVSSAPAAVVPSSVATLKSAVPDNATTVQYRRWGGVGWRGPGWRGYGWRGYPYRYGYGWGWGWPYYGAAFATGAYVGAAATAPYYYAPPPAYYGPPPVAGGPVRQCWIETDGSRGYGYYRPC